MDYKKKYQKANTNKAMAKKRPLCLVDKVVSSIAEHPQEALEQNILKYDNDFWRKVYEKIIYNYDTQSTYT